MNDTGRQNAALAILGARPAQEFVVPAQALAELFVVLVRKANRPPAEARAAVLGWADAFPILATTGTVLVEAMQIAATHRLAFWDAVMLAAAAGAACRRLLSEDMQDGFTWRGVTVCNPFATAVGPIGHE